MADNGRSALQIQEDEAEHRRQMEAQEAVAAGLSDDEKAARIRAGVSGFAQGVAPGFAEEGIKTGSGIADLTLLGARLASGPLDHLFSPPGQSASDRFGGAGLNLLGSVLNYAQHPSQIGAG